MCSHVLGQYLSWQRSSFTLNEPVYCIFAPTKTYLWNIRVSPSFRPLRGIISHQKTRSKDPSLLSCSYHIPILCVVNVNCELSFPTHVKEVLVSLFYSLSNLRDSLTLLSLAYLIYNQRISWNLLMPPTFIVVNKIHYKTLILWSILLNCW